MQTTEHMYSSSRPARWVEPVRRSDAQMRSKPLENASLALGLLSIGLGLTELVAPRQVARWVGLDDGDDKLRVQLMAMGVREITCGVGLLSRSRPAAWTWARMAGDLMDMALIGSAVRSGSADRSRALGALATVAGVTAVDAGIASALSRHNRSVQSGKISVARGITICRRPDDVYAFFRDFENLPTFMSHLEFVRVHNGRSHWRARGPLGVGVEWDAEIVEDRPGEVIAWRSVAGADVANRGRVRFRPVRGRDATEIYTELIVELDYEPPAGKLGSTVAKLFGEEPAQQVAGDLRRLKQVLETGEVLHSDASIHRRMHPARPSRSTYQLPRPEGELPEART
jgi:uncharacterized membrane protein